jgi:Ca2+-binding RTX toxin-like protein
MLDAPRHIQRFPQSYEPEANSSSLQAIVFIDSAVADYASLLTGIAPATEVVLLDASRDGVEQITRSLQRFPHLTTVHLVSHGSPGCLSLGNTQLSLDTLAQYAAHLQTWCSPSSSHSPPTLLLYGCNVAAGDAGAELLAKLHQLTGMAIAASAKPTGSSRWGGDWDLEVRLGASEVLLAFSPAARAAYDAVLATFTVTSTNDDGAGSLRQAIQEANALEGEDAIEFNLGAGNQTITLSSGRLDISDDLVITGSGADNLTVSGNRASAVFLVNDNTDSRINVEMSGLTIADGVLPTGAIVGAGIRNDENLILSRVTVRNNQGGSRGTGIGNLGFLRLSESVVTNNSNRFRGGVGGAGGIANFSGATLEIDSSTISGNVAAKNGGGIINNGTLRITNSTISDNRVDAAATGFGGAGIFNSFNGTLSINNSTISNNEIELNSDSNRDTFVGGGINVNSGLVSVANTIVANNTIRNSGSGAVTNSDVAGSFNSGGYNLISAGTGSTGFNGPGDQVGVDPLLGPLQENGGPTPTRAPLAGSPAINAGNPNFAPPPEFDQRGPGFPRVQGGRLDIGAVESPAAPIEGTSGNDLLLGTAAADQLNGLAGNDLIIAAGGDDTLTGGGDRDRFAIASGDGTDTITDFGGVGPGTNPSRAVRREVDTLQFFGNGLTAENLLLTQNGTDLELTFAGIENTKVILQNFPLQNLENLAPRRNSAAIGNILFDGELEIQDRFDVADANATPSSVFRRNTVTFLNNRNNQTSGFDRSDDVINGQGGNDRLSGRSGNDLLRGNDGNDTLRGGDGRDRLEGSDGNDVLEGGAGNDNFSSDGLAILSVNGRQVTFDAGLFGGDGNDTLKGGSGNNDLFGEAGDDHLIGGNGRDLLDGGEGNDLLEGGAGTSNFFVGGAGNDTLVGGAGTDQFAYNAALEGPFDQDIIRNFSQGADQIQLRFFGVTSIDQLTLSIVGGNTIIDLSSRFARPIGSDTITVAGVTTLDNNDFFFFN